jgi:hypothetical protein
MPDEKLTEPEDIDLDISVTDLAPATTPGDMPVWSGSAWSADTLRGHPYPIVVEAKSTEAFAVKSNSVGNSVLAVNTTDGLVDIKGDLTVYGNATFTTTDNLTVTDSMIHLADGNTGDLHDIGFYGTYVNSGTHYAVFFRDATDSRFKLGVTDVEPNLTVGTYTLGTLELATLYATTLNGTVGTESQPNITTLAGLTTINTGLTGVLKATAGVLATGVTTSDIPQGTNLYFTNAAARLALSGTNGVSYNDTTGVIQLDSTYSPTFAAATLSNLTASRLVATDENKLLASTNLSSWIAGTSNQITVTNNGSGGVTLSTPQSIGTGSTPTFANLILSSLASSSTSDVVYYNSGTGALTYGALSAGTYLDGTFRVSNTSDNTKKLAFDVSNVSAGTARTLYVFDNDMYPVSIRGSTSLACGNPNYTFTSASNTIYGINTGNSLTSGVQNTMLGSASLASLSSSSNCTGVGHRTLQLNNADNNTALGSLALTVCIGANNTALGYSAGSTLTSGTGNIFIGALSAPAAITNTNSIVIGNSTTGNGSGTTTIGTGYVSSANTANLLCYNTSTGLVSYGGQNVATSASPSFTGLTISGLTADRLVTTTTGGLTQATNLSGTSNQVTVTGLGTTSITLSTPQDIATTSTPQFAGLGLGAAYTTAGVLNITRTTTLDSSISCTGTITNSSANGGAIVKLSNVFYHLSSTGNFTYGLVSDPTFRCNSGTMSGRLAAIYAKGVFSGHAATITTAYGLFSMIDTTSMTGTVTTFAAVHTASGTYGGGTVTNNYGGYFTNPGGGTNRVALYADNLAIGVTNTAPPTNGILIAGDIKMNGSSSGSITIDAGASPTAYTLTLPSSAGTNNFALTTNGSGTTSWSAIVNSITGTANQVIASSATGDVTLSLPQSIGTGSTPTFANLILSSLASSSTSNVVYYNSGTGALTYETLSAGTYLDGTFRISNTSDTTKKLAFDVSNVSTGTVRTMTIVNNPIYTTALVNSTSLASGRTAYTFTGIQNTVFGVNSGGSIGTGENNVFIGYGTGSVGKNNVFVGNEIGPSMTIGVSDDCTGNTIVGHTSAGGMTTASANTIVGAGSSQLLSSGTYNCVFGQNTAAALTTGNFNIAMGVLSLNFVESGEYNVSIGSDCGSNITGSQNISMGYGTLNSAVPSSFSQVIAIGTNALALCVGSNNIAVGYNAGSNITSGTKNLFLGYGAVAAAATNNNCIVLGEATGNGSGTTTIGTGYVSSANTANLLCYNTSTGLVSYGGQDVASSASPSFTGLTISGVTANTLSYFNGSKALASVTLGASLSLSTGTLNTIQAITTASSPSFTGLTISGLTASRLVTTTTGGLTQATNFVGTSNQITVTGLGTTSITLSTPQNTHTAATPQFGGMGLGAAYSSSSMLNITRTSASMDSSISCIGTITNLSTNGAAVLKFSNIFTYTGASINNMYGIVAEPTFRTTSGASTLSGQMGALSVRPLFASHAGTITTAYGVIGSLSTASMTGTITTYAAIFASTGSYTSGTVTNAYGGYFNNPSGGTNRVALYADNLAIGVTNTAPPTNGMLIAGDIKMNGSTSGSITLDVGATPTTYTFVFPSTAGTNNYAMTTDGSGTTSWSAIVNSITGTTNQVVASAATGSVTLSLPQDIATSSNVTFNSVTGSSQIQAGVAGLDTSTTSFAVRAQRSKTYTTGGGGVIADFYSSDASNPIALRFGLIGDATAANQGVWIDVFEDGVTNDRPFIIQRYGGSTTIGSSSANSASNIYGITQILPTTQITQITSTTYGLQISQGGSGPLALGTSAGTTYIQSFAGLPLEINTLGNAVTIGESSTSINLRGITTCGTSLGTSGSIPLQVVGQFASSSSGDIAIFSSNESLPSRLILGLVGSATPASRCMFMNCVDLTASIDIPLCLQNSTGFVGIGVTAPTVKLDVSGGIKASGESTVGNLLTNDGTSGLRIRNASDATKIARFDASNISTGTTRVIYVLNNDMAFGALVNSTSLAAGDFGYTFTGTYNTFYGIEAGDAISTASYVTGIGYRACRNVEANNTIGIGYLAGQGAVGTSTGTNNVFVGYESGKVFSTAELNTGVGTNSFAVLTTGGRNSAFGANTNVSLTTGAGNTAIGYASQFTCISGSGNSSLGEFSLFFNTSSYNSAVGANSLQNVSTGSFNIGMGYVAGTTITTGSDNIVIGVEANVSAGAAANQIIIGRSTVGTADNQIRIGNASTTNTFIRGIVGVTTGVADAIAVLVDSNGQLGTVSSSERYKENIIALDKETDILYQARPVKFNYKVDETKKVTYGLIAEEMESVFPDIVVYKDGVPETIQYHLLVPLMLHMIQKLKKRIDVLEGCLC